MTETEKPLKERRTEVGLTQQELADRANVKRTLIANVESGRQRLTGINAARVFKVIEMYEANFKQGETRDVLVSTRIEQGLTQEEVAKKAGMDATDYAKWEAKIAHITDMGTILRIDRAIKDIVNEKLRATAKPPRELVSSGNTPSVYGRLVDFIGKPISDPAGDNIERYTEKEKERVSKIAFGQLVAEHVALKKELADTKAQNVNLRKKLRIGKSGLRKEGK